MKKINLYFRKKPETDRWLPLDRFILPFVRRMIRGRKISGIEKVFINLCKGLDELHISYSINKPFKLLNPDEAVVVLGIGEFCLHDYKQSNPVIAGIGLMTHPAEWPGLTRDYPVRKYLQHALWTRNIYTPYYGTQICDLWPAGIDTVKWSPKKKIVKDLDVLVYNKIMWNTSEQQPGLKTPITDRLKELGLSFTEIKYGSYKEKEYLALLHRCKAMIFLCEHESQGFACCEALAMNVPVFAWDQGWWLDPNRFKWDDPQVPATSIPFFDDRCGMSFRDLADFENKVNFFWQGVQNHKFSPRDYILDHLTLKKSAERMLALIDEVYN